MPRFAAILLAGGRATRLDGRTKPLLTIGGESLLARAVSAAAEIAADPVIVVSEMLDPALDVTWVREDPPFTGPAAALVAGLDAVPEPVPEWTLVLACDLPGARAAAAQLAADAALLPDDTDAVVLADDGGRPQWLTGLYRTAPLRRAAHALPEAGRDLPVRALMDDLAIAVVRDRTGGAVDVDTWEDLEEARRREGAPENGTGS